MINIKKALKNNRILKSLTGLDIEKFKKLVLYFEIILKEENGKRIKNDKNRQRKAGGGSKPKLDSVEAKLFGHAS